MNAYSQVTVEQDGVVFIRDATALTYGDASKLAVYDGQHVEGCQLVEGQNYVITDQELLSYLGRYTGLVEGRHIFTAD